MSKTLNPASKTAELVAAHPLAQPIEVFRAGKHTDSQGRECTFTEADLDSMVAAHAVQPAPAVIGHPEVNDPAMGWVGSLKRVGGKLYAQFKDWNPTFVDAVNAGGYRNRSVSVSKNGGGWMLNHVGWLGAKLPAVSGMAALNYSAHKLEAYEFSPGDVWESDEYQTANALDSIADLLGGLRDQLIADKGVEVANASLSSWRVDDVRQAAQRLRAIADKEASADGDDGASPNPDPDSQFLKGAKSMTFTQADIDRAAAAAGEKAREEAKAEFARQGDIAAQELAALKKQQRDSVIATQVSAWTAGGLITPAETAGMAEFMAAIEEGAAVEFKFSAADKSAAQKTSAQFFAEFVSSRKPVVKLGAAHGSGEDAGAVDATDPYALTAAAKNYAQQQAGKGVTVPLHEAVAHVAAQAQAA